MLESLVTDYRRTASLLDINQRLRPARDDIVVCILLSAVRRKVRLM